MFHFFCIRSGTCSTSDAFGPSILDHRGASMLAPRYLTATSIARGDQIFDPGAHELCSWAPELPSFGPLIIFR
uniref:Uncharacterized protein n=1 Tax=Monomastix sp. (strain OKE-1) TaxID=141716 RepID=U5YET3_MONSK|nr:hypothetical protein [Monomastix sp. OKE-1]AGZ90222.1 hypothetical protein [Monomastix sp. OKE-1]